MEPLADLLREWGPEATSEILDLIKGITWKGGAFLLALVLGWRWDGRLPFVRR
jgi:hypothetical protein